LPLDVGKQPAGSYHDNVGWRAADGDKRGYDNFQASAVTSGNCIGVRDKQNIVFKFVSTNIMQLNLNTISLAHVRAFTFLLSRVLAI